MQVVQYYKSDTVQVCRAEWMVNLCHVIIQSVCIYCLLTAVIMVTVYRCCVCRRNWINWDAITASLFVKVYYPQLSWTAGLIHIPSKCFPIDKHTLVVVERPRRVLKCEMWNELMVMRDITHALHHNEWLMLTKTRIYFSTNISRYL